MLRVEKRLIPPVTVHTFRKVYQLGDKSYRQMISLIFAELLHTFYRSPHVFSSLDFRTPLIYRSYSANCTLYSVQCRVLYYTIVLYTDCNLDSPFFTLLPLIQPGRLSQLVSLFGLPSTVVPRFTVPPFTVFFNFNLYFVLEYVPR